MDIKDIQYLIKFVAKSGVQEVKLEMEDIKITIKTGPDQSFIENSGMVQQVQPMPVVAQVPAPPSDIAPEAVAAPVQSEEDNLITIKSPIIGTFYRKASSDKPSFVEIGQVIKEGDVLCIIEAMKLFNEIESELGGTIVKILVDDASPIEFDQPLFVINPS
jgi:acetyl-CoA carboxylase biotin carboxyl carrier protein